MGHTTRRTPPPARFQPPVREPEPVPEPPPRERKPAPPRTSPGAAQLALALLEAGTSISEAARRTRLSRTTVRGLWAQAGHTEPPPGSGKGAGRGSGHKSPITSAQARKALEMRGQRQANGRWERSISSIAAELGVPSRTALYRAMGRAEKAGGKEEES